MNDVGAMRDEMQRLHEKQERELALSRVVAARRSLLLTIQIAARDGQNSLKSLQKIRAAIEQFDAKFGSEKQR